MMKVIRQKLSKMDWRAVLLLSVMLLCAQVSALEHSAEHYFHGSQELCHSFIVYDTSADKVSQSSFSFLPIIKTEHLLTHATLPSLDTVRFALIRAPPQFTFS